jgi:DNA-directed RNA polymerase I subunit RPA1
MTWQFCAGHPGHIELPVPCYHTSFFEQTLRLVRAQCVYCHRLRMPRNQIDLVIFKLRLLQYGLLEELRHLEMMQMKSKDKFGKAEDVDMLNDVQPDSGEEEDLEDFRERQSDFVKKSILRARKRNRDERIALLRNPAAIAERRAIVSEFMLEITRIKKCSSCQGISPSYRKDRNSKVFEKPLNKKQRDQMKAAGLVATNPLLMLSEEAKQEIMSQKPLVNGYHKNDVDMQDQSGSEGEELHGAEEEIARVNAQEAAAQEAVAEEGEDVEEPTQKYKSSLDVHAALKLLFRSEQKVLKLIYSSRPSRKDSPLGPDMFFITRILVPPSKFRPTSKTGDTLTEAPQNGILNRIIKASDDIQRISHEMQDHDGNPALPKRGLAEWQTAAVALQEYVNGMIDNAPNAALGRQNEIGIKQIFEKKEGLFRMNMMGKRVNFAARSVISPDPNIETNEIGVPLVFAKKLTYTEPVTSHNFMELKQAVINGPTKYPGAAAIEDEYGRVTSLKFKTPEQRLALAQSLLTPSNPGLKGSRNKKVDRHLQSGDVVIMNRQPTLHKPSMMGHRARVLQNEKTIRMHYANCNTYNADFDGDEMNMHFPQNEIARSEAFQIADTDHQYLSATAGKPLRGLIQDHISMGVQFTSRDTFFDRDAYQQLLYYCLRPESGHTTLNKLELVPPAIFKPIAMWTGKQVISTILKNIKPENRHGLNLTSMSSTSADHWLERSEKDPSEFEVRGQFVKFRDTEQTVMFKDGEHLCGILDKAQLGPSAGGLIHSVYELYGHIAAGKLLSIMGRLLTRYLSERAWTCGVDDLYLTQEGDNVRRQKLSQSTPLGLEVASKYVSLDPKELSEQDQRLRDGLEGVLRNEDQQAGLDQAYNSRTNKLTGEITKSCLPAGLRKPFPKNQMQAMTISGAKGSNVNASLISCNLGQQVLEGKRVPTMVSGKTLPAFRAFETDPSAGGYVSGRFLTGINPKEYFFHAMSGREGLIDTAVKTSKSGYLQRCVIKGLEGLRTEYDTSVRESSNGAVIQFLYGEDGLEITKQKRLTDFPFLAQNIYSVIATSNATEELKRFANPELEEQQKEILKAVWKGQAANYDPIMTLYPPASSQNLGSTSESFATLLAQYVKDNPNGVIRDKKKHIGFMSKRTFIGTMNFKYMKSVVEAGEAVGVVAAQSVGEPSTQMTLNTFHLAGHSAKNVTLGIPRLREILMTASVNISTPMMILKPILEISEEDGIRFAKSISKLSLAELIQDLSVMENSNLDRGMSRDYRIDIQFWPSEEYREEYAISIADVAKALTKRFLPRLDKMIADEMKKKAKEAALSQTTAAVPDVGVSLGRDKSPPREGSGDPDCEGGEDDEDADEDIDPEDAKQTATKGRQDAMYEESDEDEAIAAEVSSDESSASDDEESREAKRNRPKERENAAQNLQEQNADDSGHTDNEGEDQEVYEDEEQALKALNPHLVRYKFNRKKDICRIQLSYVSNAPKLLLLPIVEKCAHASVVQSIPGLTNCVHTIKKTRDPVTGAEGTENIITTSGVNLLAMRDYQDIINPHTLYTNSVHAMLELYGVEAARATIVKEIDGVFKGHGISVDLRHLLLIGDAMTQSGGYKAFSRNGVVRESGSVLAKMSFETVMGFLKDAVLEGEVDSLMGPSARIVVGKRGAVGTGSFDVVVPVGTGGGSGVV